MRALTQCWLLFAPHTKCRVCKIMILGSYSYFHFHIPAGGTRTQSTYIKYGSTYIYNDLCAVLFLCMHTLLDIFSNRNMNLGNNSFSQVQTYSVFVHVRGGEMWAFVITLLCIKCVCCVLRRLCRSCVFSRAPVITVCPLTVKHIFLCLHVYTDYRSDCRRQDVLCTPPSLDFSERGGRTGYHNLTGVYSLHQQNEEL